MRITSIRSGEDSLDIEIDGAYYPLTTHRPTLWAQGVVVLPPQLEGSLQAFLQNPDDENSPLASVENAVDSKELAELQRQWAAGELAEGVHEVALTI